MQARVDGNTVTVEGYVNAVERKSKPLWSRFGEFVERICKGAFAKALERSDDVRILLNHDWCKDLGGTATGELDLREDAIGLHATAKLSDPEVVELANKGELVGWSFGFKDRKVRNTVEQGVSVREVQDLDLFEVSILAGKNPAYEGTLVTVREDSPPILWGLPLSQGMEPDYSWAEKIMQEIRGVPGEAPNENTNGQGV